MLLYFNSIFTQNQTFMSTNKSKLLLSTNLKSVMYKVFKQINTFSFAMSLLLFSFYANAQDNALSFDGLDDQVVLANEPNFDFTTAVTVEARLFITALPTSDNVYSVINKREASGRSNFGINFSNSFLYFYVNDGSWQLLNLNPNVLPLNQWFHLAASYSQEAGGVRIIAYLNGTEIGNQFFAGVNLSTTNNNDPVRIGHRVGNIEYFNGLIDEVRIWNVIRSAGTIDARKACQLTGTETGLVAYYQFNQGTAGGNNAGLNTLNDLAGTADNGTLTNFTLSGASSNWVAGQTLTTCPNPTITNITPTSGGIDTRITITGTNFVAGQVVTINGTPARRVWYYSPTQIVAQVGDATIGTGNVVIETASSATIPQTFTVTTCAAPTSVVASTGAANTASINVSWSNPATVERADVIYRLADPTVQALPPTGAEFTRVNTGQTASGSRNFTITGLDASKIYEVYVQIRCIGGAWSNWVASSPATVTSSGGTGATCLKPTTILPTNNTTLGGLSTNFTWNPVTNSTSYQVFVVEVDGATPPVPVGGTSQVITTSTTNATVYFTKTNTKYRLQVRSVCGSSFGEYSDAIYVTSGTGTACLAPATLNTPTISAGTGTFANGTFTWSVGSAATGSPKYDFHIQYPTGIVYAKTSDTEGTSWTGLGDGAYNYRVRSNCTGTSSNFSAWKPFTVSGYPTCAAPTSPTITSVTSSAATVNWSGTTGAGRAFRVDYWNTSSPNIIYAKIVTTLSTTLTVGEPGLVANGTYGVRIWSLCDDQLYDFVNTAGFTYAAGVADRNTLGEVATQGSITSDLLVYPNPVNDQATVSYTSANNANLTLTVVDVLGREVYRTTTSDGKLSTKINVKTLQAGIYLVKVQDGTQSFTKKLVVE